MGASDKELMLSVPDSKELDANRQGGALAEKSSQSVAFEELLEVVPRAMAKLNLDWSDEVLRFWRNLYSVRVHNQASMCKHG